jgi:hypothetical protein
MLPRPVDHDSKTGIAELKNGKVVFKQKPHSFEKHSETLQGVLLNFSSRWFTEFVAA